MSWSSYKRVWTSTNDEVSFMDRFYTAEKKEICKLHWHLMLLK